MKRYRGINHCRNVLRQLRREATTAVLTNHEVCAAECVLGYLREMGIRTWREVQPDFPPEMIGQIISTYFGGRAEVRIRRQKRQVLYCDFLSMYPTVCTLMGLWRFVIGTGMEWTDATAETQALLDRIEPAHMMRQDAWSQLTTIVQLRPQNDILPIRAKFGGGLAANIGVNSMTSSDLRWYTMADVIAAKMLGDGKVPIIERAVRFSPKEMQPGLQPIDIAGNPAFHVEPAKTDFYRRVIDLRRKVKATPAESSDDAARLKSEQLALKILANATSYGIFIEMIVQPTRTSHGIWCRHRRRATSISRSRRRFHISLQQ